MTQSRFNKMPSNCFKISFHDLDLTPFKSLILRVFYSINNSKIRYFIG